VLAPGKGLVLDETIGRLVRRVGLARPGLGDRGRNRCFATKAPLLGNEQAAQGGELALVRDAGAERVMSPRALARDVPSFVPHARAICRCTSH
jgi:hypothetical protein